METVILVYHSEATDTVMSAHGKKVHGVVVHPYELLQLGSLFRADVVGVVLWGKSGEASVAQVEAVSPVIVVEIGV